MGPQKGRRDKGREGKAARREIGKGLRNTIIFANRSSLWNISLCRLYEFIIAYSLEGLDYVRDITFLFIHLL